MHNEERSGRPSLVTAELVHAIDGKIREDIKFTINALYVKFPNTSRLLVHKVITEKLGF